MRDRELIHRIRDLADRQEYVSVVASLSDVAPALLESNPDVGLMYAHALLVSDNLEQGLSVARQLKGVCLRSGNLQLKRRRDSIEATLLFARGDLDAAITGWTAVLEEAAEDADYLLLARAANNLGMAADIRCEFLTATAHYLRALSAYQSLGDGSGIMGVQANLGITYRKCGKADLAEDYLSRALDYSISARLPYYNGLIEVEKGVLYLITRDITRAENSARKAKALFQDVNSTGGLAETSLLLGRIRADVGNWQVATEEFSSALRLSRDAKRRLVEAETLEEWGVLLWQRHDLSAATEMISGATAIYQQFGANRRIEWMQRRLESPHPDRPQG